MKKYQNIPTNIVTGFLGVGKTTVIKNLLHNKPKLERWAVLVNEFGEVGIDGALMNADGIAVKEVAGGCMCCAVGVPSRTALNRLIREHNPHRIIIEPTGLAHPKKVLDIFNGKEYQGVLDIRAVVCLVDPWSVTQERFLQLSTFVDQVNMADVVVATKGDVSSNEQLSAFQVFAHQMRPEKQQVGVIADGQLPLPWLDLKHRIFQAVTVPHHHGHAEASSSNVERQIDEQGVVRSESVAEFGFSCGWVFPKEQVFVFEKLYTSIKGLTVLRVKGVFYTDRGCYAINRMREVLSSELIESTDIIDGSRVEMVDTEKHNWLLIDRLLRDCRCES